MEAGVIRVRLGLYLPAGFHFLRWLVAVIGLSGAIAERRNSQRTTKKGRPQLPIKKLATMAIDNGQCGEFAKGIPPLVGSVKLEVFN